MQSIRGFLKDERGLETVEWAIIVGLIVGALITLMVQIGNWVEDQYTALKSEIGG